MENASKALIIAGAILISIVLVSVGVIVVNSLNTDDATTAMTEQEIETFNSKFTKSEGLNKTGTVVKSLLNTVMTNNASYTGDDEKTIVVLDGTNGNKDRSADLSTFKNEINSSSRYDITMERNGNGIVYQITITKR